MEDNKEIIDYGSWVIPTNWDEITLDMFSDIERYYEDKDKRFDIRDVLHIITGKSNDEINALPAEFLDKILEKLLFINEKQPNFGEPTNEIVINGEKYIVNVFEKLKTGEYVSFDMALKNDKHDYSTFLAILCRKCGEAYDSKYEAELFEERKKMFGSMPVGKMFPVISFFLGLYLVQERHSQLYLQVEEVLNRIQQAIHNSHKIGASKRLSLNWQMMKLRKLLKSNKNI